MIDFSLLEKEIGVKFKNKNLLITAFTHRSYINEQKDFSFSHNERLEFLGDAILEMVVTEYLYCHYPEYNEGEMTAWRAALVNANILCECAKELNLDKFLLLSKGEKQNTGKARDTILANCLEAFIGALYLDQGIKKVKEFIEKNILKKLKGILEEKKYQDSKTIFQEIAQKKVKITPVYKTIKEWGPDHSKHFIVGVYLGDELVAEGEGPSKQEAEKKAADNALIIKKW